MRSYRCFYLMKGDEPSPPFIQIHATDAVSAAQAAMQATRCGHVTDVIRIEDASTRGDLARESRHAWLRHEQQPSVKQHAPQSDFEQSPYWRVCLLIALIVIGINVFSPDPEQSRLAVVHGTRTAV
jgi:hypothetical protein